MTHIAQPNPPRYWWLKRLSLIGLMLLLCVIGLRLCWGWYWSNQLQAMVQGVADQGAPIHFDDMQLAPVADAQNKLYYIRQARAAWPTIAAPVAAHARWRPGEDLDALEANNEPGRPQTEQVLIIESAWWQDRNNQPDPIQDNQAYLDQITQAVALLQASQAAPFVDPGVHLQMPPSAIRMPYLGEVRQMAQLLGDAAERSFAIGDAQRGLDYLTMIIELAESCETPISATMGHVVGLSVQAIALRILADHASILPVSARKQMQALIRQLMDERDLQERFTRALQSERWSNYNTTMHLVNTLEGAYAHRKKQMAGNHPHWMATMVLWIIQPLFVQDTVVSLAHLSDAVQASRDAPTFLVFSDNLQRSFLEMDQLFEERSFQYLLSRISLAAPRLAMRSHYQLIAERRLAATALAVRLFEMDHGRRPDTLDDLVPDYLDAVPVDPWSPMAASIQYLPQGSLRQSRRYARAYEQNKLDNVPAPQRGGPALVYSVGINQIDHGGIVLVDEAGRMDASMRFRHTDQWFSLEAVAGAAP